MTNPNFSKAKKYIRRENGSNVEIPEDDVKETEKELKENAPAYKQRIDQIEETIKRLATLLQDREKKQQVDKDEQQKKDEVIRGLTEQLSSILSVVTENQTDTKTMLDAFIKIKNELKLDSTLQQQDTYDQNELRVWERRIEDKLDEALATILERGDKLRQNETDNVHWNEELEVFKKQLKEKRLRKYL